MTDLLLENQRLVAKVGELQAALADAQRTIFAISSGSPKARSSDPATSALAVVEAIESGKRAGAAVYTIMLDGIERIDEEMLPFTQAIGYRGHLARINHGRLALQLAGFLRNTGLTRLTVKKRPSIIWALTDYEFEKREMIIGENIRIRLSPTAVGNGKIVSVGPDPLGVEIVTMPSGGLWNIGDYALVDMPLREKLFSRFLGQEPVCVLTELVCRRYAMRSIVLGGEERYDRVSMEIAETGGRCEKLKESLVCAHSPEVKVSKIAKRHGCLSKTTRLKIPTAKVHREF